MKATKNVYKFLFPVIALFIFAGIFTSCLDDDDDDDVYPVVEWRIDLNSKLQNPSLANRPETGLLQMILYNNGILSYQVSVKDLTTGDVLTAAHFHTGDPLTNGPVIQNFNPVFSGNTASGSLELRSSFIDSLMNTSNEIYFNVHSQQAPDGLVRGQVNSDILVAATVPLNGASEIPPTPSTATGTAVIRVAVAPSFQKVYSNVTVTGNGSDALTMAHIHKGDTKTNGGVLVTLCESASDFGVNKVISITSDIAKSLKKDSTYVNVHSVAYPNGLIRGKVYDQSLFGTSTY